MEILGYLFLSIMAVAIIVLFAKLLTYTFKSVVDNDD